MSDSHTAVPPGAEQAESAMPEAQAEQGQSAEADALAEAGQPVEKAVDLETLLLQAQEQAAEYLDGWQRARAELANYRKRVEREREGMRGQLRGDVILGLLPVVDDFDRAMASLPDGLAGHEWVNGIELIYRKFRTQLAEMGLTEIEALGQPFDPEQHEAVMQREAGDQEKPGHVAEVLRKGYRLDNRVLRPAMVVVTVETGQEQDASCSEA